MEYECKFAQMDRVIISANGEIEPLCNSCFCVDCSNPIRKVDISIFGINKQYKLYKTYNGYIAVIACEGYLPKEKLYDNIDQDDVGIFGA